MPGLPSPLLLQLRWQLEAYLKLTKVWRSPPGNPYLSIADVTRNPKRNGWRFNAAWLQFEIDKRLRRVLDGEDARVVFALDKKRPGLKPRYARQQAAVCEVARLVAAGLTRPTAIDEVVAFFGETPRTIERWCSRWNDRTINVRKYIVELKNAKLM